MNKKSASLFWAGVVIAAFAHAGEDGGFRPQGLEIGGTLGGVWLGSDENFTESVRPQARAHLIYWLPLAWGVREFDRLGLEVAGSSMKVLTNLDTLAPGELVIQGAGLNFLMSLDLNRAEGGDAWIKGWHTYFGLGGNYYFPRFKKDSERTQEQLPEQDVFPGSTVTEMNSEIADGFGVDLKIGVSREFASGWTMGALLSASWIAFEVEREYTVAQGTGAQLVADSSNLVIFPVFFGFDLGYKF